MIEEEKNAESIIDKDIDLSEVKNGNFTNFIFFKNFIFLRYFINKSFFTIFPKIFPKTLKFSSKCSIIKLY